MNWDKLDNDNTFRIVFTDYQQAQTYDFSNKLLDLINWRNYQQLPKPELYVIKIGYSNFLDYYSLESIENFFIENHELFQGNPVRFSLYQNIQNLNNYEKINDYQKMASNLKKYNIYCTIAWVFDFHTINDITAINTFFDLFKNKLSQYESINHVVVLHNTSILSDKTYPLLSKLINICEAMSNISGYDITSHINNFNVSNFAQDNIENPSNLLALTKFLLEYHNEFAEKIVPEIKKLYSDDFSNNQTISEQIEEFCRNGYIINISQNTISPLIYGSADDFSFNSDLTLSQFLLMTYSEIFNHFEKQLKKLFLKSYCAQCDHLSFCQQQKIYWLNLPFNKECYIKIDPLLNGKY